MPVVKSRWALSSERKQRNVGSHYAGAIDASVLVLEELAQVAPCVHPAGQAVIGTAKEREVVFDGAEQRAGCVLPLRGAFAKPAIVRQVHQKVGIFPRCLASDVRKNIFETNQHRSLHFQVRQLESYSGVAGSETSFNRCEVLQERKPMRDVLA